MLAAEHHPWHSKMSESFVDLSGSHAMADSLSLNATQNSQSVHEPIGQCDFSFATEHQSAHTAACLAMAPATAPTRPTNIAGAASAQRRPAARRHRNKENPYMTNCMRFL